MPRIITAGCSNRGVGQCVVDFSEYTDLSVPIYVNQVATSMPYGGDPYQCTWWANSRVQQVSGYYMGAWNDGACYAGHGETLGFPVYKNADEALAARGTLAGFVISMGRPRSNPCVGGYSGCDAMGSNNHVAVTEGYDPDTGILYVSEMWGSIANGDVLLNSYYPTDYNTSCIWWLDLSSVGFSANGSGRKRYFKETFGEFHWPVTPVKDGRMPTKVEYQEFCNRLNQAQDEAKVENKTTFDANQDNGILTANRFNEYLYLMQESDDGNLLGVDEEECPWMSNVVKNDVIYAKHFLQLENLYNAWCYGSNIGGSGEVVAGDGVAETCWLTLSAAYGNVAAAGIMGNIAQECGFNPYADNGSHYGICQWGCYFAEIYYDRPGLEKQLDYLLHGQTSSYRTTCGNPTYAGYGSIDYMFSYYNGSVSAFMSLTDPYTAATYFFNHYENAPGQFYNRGTYAQQAYNYYVNGTGSWPWAGV